MTQLILFIYVVTGFTQLKVISTVCITASVSLALVLPGRKGI